MLRTLDLPWDVLTSFRYLFTPEENRYISLRHAGMTRTEALKEIGVSQRTFYYHQRNIYFKWIEYLYFRLYNSLGYPVGYQFLPVSDIPAKSHDIEDDDEDQGYVPVTLYTPKNFKKED